MTASPKISFLPYSDGWPTTLRTSFGVLEDTATGGMALSPSVILVCRGQDHPRQYILAIWILFVRPRTFLPPQRGLWAQCEVGWGRQILQPHNSPSKSCCTAPQAGRRILMLSGLCHGRSSLVPLWVPRPFSLPKAHSWCFDVQSALSLILLWDDADRFGIRSVHLMAPL